VRDRILHTYGIKAEVLAPPSNIDVGGEVCSLDLAPGFFLCVARLLPYKNVDAVLGAFSRLPSERLVVVGSGPDLERLRALAPSNATFIQEISDAELRWLYANSSAVVSAAYEDFGLTPVEGGSFGKPSVVLRYGGFLDTVREGLNGVFFDEPEPEAIARAVALASQRAWEGSTIRGHSELFAPEVFVARLRSIVEDTGRS
jgi:glycosyltransferase involved in cell wall biosynthesis